MVTITGSLIGTLKLKNPSLYNWFVDHSIDPSNLNKYISAMALAINMATHNPVITKPVNTKATQTSIEILTSSDLVGKDDIQKANMVWNTYGSLIRDAAIKYDLDPNLIFATIMVESGGNTYAKRDEPRLGDASYGLGQLLYGTAKGLGYRGTPDGLYDPQTNIELIAKYHKRNFDHYQDLTPVELTIAYNTGSPYKHPYPGHLTKFDKWYNSLANLEVDLS